jgi:hypothetical protein
MTIPGMPPWALPPAPVYAPPGGLPDPPLVQRQPDGSLLALPMNMPDLWGPGYNIPGGWDDATQINQALQQARSTGAIDAYLGGFGQTGGKVVLLANAIYTTQTDIIVPPGVWLEGGGRGTIIACTHQANGHGIYAHGDEHGGANIQGVGTKISNLLIDATAIAPAITFACLDYGDQYDIVLEDVTVQNNLATGTTNALGPFPLGGVGFNWNNVNTLTEKLFMRRCTANNCGPPNFTANPNQGAGGAALQLMTTGGAINTSRMYSDIDLHINQQAGQHGVVIARQGLWENGRAVVRGNMNCPASGLNGAAGLVIGVANVGGGSAQAGHVVRMEFDWHIESDGTVQPYDIYFGTNADNQFLSSGGRLQFLDGFTSSNVSGFGNFGFSGRLHSPGSALVTAVLPAASPVLGTVYQNNGIDALVSIFGGTVSGVVINSIGTGQTSGTFLIRNNATIQVNGTVAPSWSWACALAL